MAIFNSKLLVYQRVSLVYPAVCEASLGSWDTLGHRAQCCRKTPTTRCNLPAVRNGMWSYC